MTDDTMSAGAFAIAAIDAGGSNDDALMVAYCNGHAASFENLYRRHKGAVYRFFLRQMPKCDAEECHHEVWIKVIKGRSSYEPRGSFVPWLFTIAHRVLTDRHRSAMRRPIVAIDNDPDLLPSSNPGPEDATDQARKLNQLHALIAELPITQREALLLREEAGLSLAEIAAVTSTAEEGVKSRLRYAMQKLRAGMSP